jgi:hypothetical protein
MDVADLLGLIDGIRIVVASVVLPSRPSGPK